MSTKAFCPNLYRKCDGRGKKAAVEFLKPYGWELYDASEGYKMHDLIFIKNGINMKVEIEVSPSWTRDDWPYHTFTVPYRKSESKASIYLYFNWNLTSVIVCPVPVIHHSPVITKNTKYTQNEKFYSISLPNIDLFTPDSTPENRWIP